jgi:hypothetical protein
MAQTLRQLLTRRIPLPFIHPGEWVPHSGILGKLGPKIAKMAACKLCLDLDEKL